ncbi:MAG: SMC-Scp complex subunit ScpB, partial [Parcubacteria group bacterium]|nr:SMC-Scp complex subunit ScpB [Parcubacteria group bacterium]
MDDLERKIEAILFIAGEPIEFQKLAELLEVSLDDLKNSLEKMENEYKNNRGLSL